MPWWRQSQNFQTGAEFPWFSLTYFNERSCDEIAADLDISRNHVAAGSQGVVYLLGSGGPLLLKGVITTSVGRSFSFSPFSSPSAEKSGLVISRNSVRLVARLAGFFLSIMSSFD